MGGEPCAQPPGWLYCLEECEWLAVWIGPHRHLLRGDGTMGVILERIAEAFGETAPPAPPVPGGQPGGGCGDPREVHRHWCGFCGAALLRDRAECRSLVIIPPCPRCGERDWRDDIDGLGAP